MRSWLGLTSVFLATINIHPAWAGPFSVEPLVVASAPSPFAACTADDAARQPGKNFLNGIVEPWVQINPTNPSNIIAGYQQ